MVRDISSQGVTAPYVMQHTYSPKARATRYLSLLFHVTILLNPLLFSKIVSIHTPEPEILGIASVENGILLRKDLHATLFGHSGHAAFLKVCEAGINSDIF
jgi:hypothetical protein